MESDTFIVALGAQTFTVSKKLADVSQYFHNILSLGIDQQEIQIDPQIIDRETFHNFLKFCEINEYKQPIVARKIKTNNLQEVVDSKNFQFIKEFSIQSPELMKLLGAANFLVCRGLKLVIAAIYACKVYFQDTKEAYLQKKKELGIPQTENITFQDDQKFRQDFYTQESMIDQ